MVARYSQDVPTGYGLSHGPYVRDVLESLSQGRTDVSVGVEEGLKTLRFLHAIYASMETGGWVRLEGVPESTRLGV